MIRKLLKVEFREAFSSMLPVGAGMLVLSALTALNSAVTARIRVSSAGFDWLGALLAFAAAVCFISVLAVCFFANVNRFYRMLGEEGYIQLTLPATMSQHIAAKLIAAVVTTLVTFLFLAVCSSPMAFPAGASWLTDMLRDGATWCAAAALAASADCGHRAGRDGHGPSAHVSLLRRRQSVPPAPQAGEHPLVLRAAISRRFSSCWRFISPRRGWRFCSIRSAVSPSICSAARTAR
ncbi:MAG: hypothetical protein ACLUI3_11440 [Christensenellales bacterium]